MVLEFLEMVIELAGIGPPDSFAQFGKRDAAALGEGLAGIPQGQQDGQSRLVGEQFEGGTRVGDSDRLKR